MQVAHAGAADGEKTNDYTFDACYDITSKQEQVYMDLGRPVVLNALDGYNSTVFACKPFLGMCVVFDMFPSILAPAFLSHA